ncbi:zinc finger A20 and AN1 domain-containing stress-associated protein 16-like, partial [Trifolium medium]|nr:zinc finger A20 and AN1 domain-containing stress-associated protein 16-like [Trifolium medium]
CPGPKKLESNFSFMSLMNRNRKQESKKTNSSSTSSSSSKWTTSFLNAASSIRASAEAGMSKLSGEINQAWGTSSDGGGKSNSSGQVEQCPQCDAKFSSVTTLVDHVQKVHERSGNRSAAKV